MWRKHFYRNPRRYSKAKSPRLTDAPGGYFYDGTNPLGGMHPEDLLVAEASSKI